MSNGSEQESGGSGFWAGYAALLDQWYKRCLEHPQWGSKVQLVSVEWLEEISNPSPSELTNLGVDKLDGQGNFVYVDMEQLLKDIKRVGLKEPLIVQAGLVTKRARLESGNHRIRLLKAAGIFHAPCLLYVASSHIGNTENGTHDGKEVFMYPNSLDVVSVGVYTESKFARISDLIPSAPVLMIGKSEGHQIISHYMGAVQEEPVAVSPVVIEKKPRKVRSDKGSAKSTVSNVGTNSSDLFDKD